MPWAAPAGDTQDQVAGLPSGADGGGGWGADGGRHAQFAL